MNELERFFNSNKGNLIHKWVHYFDIYDFYFKRFKNQPIVILEIGVFQGGSLNMWREYFGRDAKIFGIDINPECKQFETENTKIFIGSQEDREFLNYVKTQIPKIDILIDDGGHTMTQQIVSFEEMYGHVNINGIYLCEDIHTSYWENYGGGYKNPNSFIEYSKSFIDFINAWHSRDKKLHVTDFTKSTYALHYYDSILVVEKREIVSPTHIMKGQPIISFDKFLGIPASQKNSNKRFYQRLQKKIFKIIRFK